MDMSFCRARSSDRVGVKCDALSKCGNEYPENRIATTMKHDRDTVEPEPEVERAARRGRAVEEINGGYHQVLRYDRIRK
jgi:hypothetical protein